MGNEAKTRFESMTVREFGDMAAELGVSAASLLDRREPRHAPLEPGD